MKAGGLDTPWTRSLQRGDRPDAADLRAHLQEVHGQHTGFTESCAGGCRDGHGRTSYEWLAEAVPPDARRVLDLACGSGKLLDVCARTLPPGVALTGIDMSREELALARARLPAGRATLHEGLAQSLDVLADGAVDTVLCHWALTLMDPVTPVLDEVRRVLRTGGMFAAIVDGPHGSAPGYAEVDSLIGGAVRADYPAYGTHEMGDPRVREAETLLALAAVHFPGAQITLEHGVFAMEGAAAPLAAEAAGFFYSAFMLGANARSAMLDRLAALLTAQAQGGPCRFAMPVSRLVVRLAL